MNSEIYPDSKISCKLDPGSHGSELRSVSVV